MCQLHFLGQMSIIVSDVFLIVNLAKWKIFKIFRKVIYFFEQFGTDTKLFIIILN